MTKKLYVGNLSYNVKDADIEQMFNEFGEVSSATIIIDRDTGRSKGFGFVEMASATEADAAIAALNGKDHDGRALSVKEATPKPERSSGGKSGFGAKRRSY